VLPVRPTSFTTVWRDDSYLEVWQGHQRIAMRATTETGQYTSGNRRMSRTWRWCDDAGVVYRVQVQATVPEEETT
jgi:hypothetical protein